MNKIPSLPDQSVEALAKVLGECGSGPEIDRVLASCRLEDNSGQSTKWRRLNWIFLASQRRHGCSNRVLHFIESFLHPVRFVRQPEVFEAHRAELNAVLAFSGLEYRADGKFQKREAAKTLTQADQRVSTIQEKFRGRAIHPEVLKYCSAELMQDNFFHAVFEATKGLAQRIREMSGVQADGAALVDQVFSSTRPVLAFNRLETETEQSEHKGFAALLKGCFAAIRNPLAHEPRIHWEGEDNAADYLSLISLLHRKLDECAPMGL